VTAAAVTRGARPLLGAAVFVAALGAWQAAAEAHPSFLFPTATAVLERAWEVWPTSEFRGDVLASLRRLTAGYAIGAGIGVAVGLVMGSSRRVRRVLEPLTELLRATPAIAIVPAAIVILGFGESMHVGVIAFAVCFPVLVNTVDGVRAVAPEVRDTATMLHVGSFERVVAINLPAALAQIFAGLRIALSAAIILLVISEFVGSGDGVGHYITLQQSQFNVEEVYGGILFLGLLGYVLNRLFLAVERRVLAWHYGAVGDLGR
jgi:ABC-type nitrate/sulfonate/bicarbonate transport system permease component